MLYGFHESPSLNVETTWSQNHTFYIDPEFHKVSSPHLIHHLYGVFSNFVIIPYVTSHVMQELAYYLNAGSRIDVSYDVKFPGSASLSLVIAQGTGYL